MPTELVPYLTGLYFGARLLAGGGVELLCNDSEFGDKYGTPEFWTEGLPGAVRVMNGAFIVIGSLLWSLVMFGYLSLEKMSNRQMSWLTAAASVIFIVHGALNIAKDVEQSVEEPTAESLLWETDCKKYRAASMALSLAVLSVTLVLLYVRRPRGMPEDDGFREFEFGGWNSEVEQRARLLAKNKNA